MRNKLNWRHGLSLILVLTLHVLNACSPKRGNEVPVAVVAEDKIPIRVVLDAFPPGRLSFRSVAEELAEKQKFVDLLVEERLLVQEAYRRKLDLDTMLVSFDATEIPLLLIDLLYEREVREKSGVSQEELRQLHGALKNEYCLKQIVVFSEETKREVEARLRRGEPFERLMSSFMGETPLVGQAGDRGCYGWARRPPVLLFEKVFKMKPGEWAGPFPMSPGWLFLYCYELRPTEPPGWRDVETDLRLLVESGREESRSKEFLRKIRGEMEFRVIDSTARLANRKQEELSKIETPGKPTRYSVRIRINELSPRERAMPLVTYKGGGLRLGQYLENLQGSIPSARPVLDSSEATRNLLFDIVIQHVMVLAAEYRGLDRDPVYHQMVRQAVEGKLALAARERILQGVRIDSFVIRSYFANHPEEFVEPAAYYLYEINSPNEKELGRVKPSLKNKSEFSSAASQLTSREQIKRIGGEMGWVEQFQFPELFAAASKMKIGQIAGPVGLADGSFSLIYLESRRPPRKNNFEEVRGALNNKLLAQVRDSAFMTWLAEQKQKTKIVLFPEILKKTIDYDRYARLKEGETKKSGGRS